MTNWFSWTSIKQLFSLNHIIFFCFFTLFFLTPLFFTPFNNELFEFNKMILVYFLTIIVSGCWILKMINAQSLLINRTPLDIPIVLFLASQLLSAIFSIDPHTSWWGYYSRSNGGLYSIISYIVLYYAFVSNIDKIQALKLLKSVLLGGLLVSLWAIPEHFGVSPSCIVLVQSFTADCWVQDVQARVFATLGQPNWLAAYLSMLIFPSIYFFLTSKNLKNQIIYGSLTVIFYLAFTFTYSRGATLGFIAGLLIFILGYLVICQPEPKVKDLYSSLKLKVTKSKSLGIILVTFLAINLYYGSALTSFRLEQQAIAARPSILVAPVSTSTQLETGGTESGSIRLIVWQGALDIWKHYPLFGSGVETFAYSYYNFRPSSHNLVSEWDFLYNKAHNEYLNYLATTGTLGLLAYLLIIGTFIGWIFLHLTADSLSLSQKLQFTKIAPLSLNNRLLTISLLSSYISYLVQNFFGFSVVIIALLFYLIPAFIFTEVLDLKPFKGPHFIRSFFSWVLNATIYQYKILLRIIQIIVVIVTIFNLIGIINLWTADTYYKKGADLVDQGDVTNAYNYLIRAAILNSEEPLYRSDLGFAAAGSALLYTKTDAKLAAELRDEAILQTQKSLDISPNNLSIQRTAIRTYYQLGALDDAFIQKTLNQLDTAIALAPTDPKLYYNKALVLGNEGRQKEAISVLEKAIQLKPNYREGYLSLGYFYIDLKEYDKAREALNMVLKLVPNDPEAIAKLKEIENL